MAELTPIKTARDPTVVPFTAASALGDEFVNTGSELIIITNSGASPIDLTVITSKVVDGEAVADKVISVGASETHALGPWPPAIYNDADRKVQISYSDNTSVGVSIIRPGI